MPRRRWKPPYELDLAASVARFTRWGGDPVNLVADGVYYRVAGPHADEVPYAARQLPAGAIEVTVGDGHDPDPAMADMRYRLAESLPFRPLRSLARRDPVVRAALRRRPGYRPPMTPDLFEALVTSITAQQVNLRWATTTRRRLVETYGRRRRFPGTMVWQFPAAAALAAADPADLRSLQLTTAKSHSIVGVARAAADGALDGLAEAPDAEVVERLTALRGVGRWTAEWALARCLGRPAAVAAGDLGVREAIGRAYLGRRATEDEVRAITTPWGDAANWATHLLLEGLSD